MMLWWVVDLTLCALMIALAAGSLFAATLRRRVIFFIAFGLLTAIVWARLQAPDLALAEAAIGAGLTGALLLAALPTAQPTEHKRDADRLIEWVSLLLAALLAVVLIAVLTTLLPVVDGDPSLAVTARLSDAGVSHPVTAVLLNFRAWDTLLELAVLLCATIGVLNLAPARKAPRHAGALADTLIRILLPLLILTAGYLLWNGAFAPGGAFQAGAVLAAATVVLHLGGGVRLPPFSLAQLRGLLALGLLLFLSVGLVQLAFGQALLQYPLAWAGSLILLIETGATLSIATMLSLVYLGGHPLRDWPVAGDSRDREI
ncbi:MnhB domain-containing protein [Motiliproteus sp. SC1-56]|uniref:MnhB domain-containing protein n=1 Tax=Motiliproteus sp. SC1-56 TaxID=2799565 RepID=UPI001A8DB2D4|nr:MnhB domain-containing protein [Motiliproteus sp. SC1-56]